VVTTANTSVKEGNKRKTVYKFKIGSSAIIEGSFILYDDFGTVATLEELVIVFLLKLGLHLAFGTCS